MFRPPTCLGLGLGLGGGGTKTFPEVGAAEFVVGPTMRIPHKIFGGGGQNGAVNSGRHLCQNLFIVCLSAHKMSLTNVAWYLGALFSPLARAGEWGRIAVTPLSQ